MRIYIPAWLLFWPYGWEFACDYPGCASQAEYEEKSLARAESRLRADGWARYPEGTHACPAHVSCTTLEDVA